MKNDYSRIEMIEATYDHFDIVEEAKDYLLYQASEAKKDMEETRRNYFIKRIVPLALFYIFGMSVVIFNRENQVLKFIYMSILLGFAGTFGRAIADFVVCTRIIRAADDLISGKFFNESTEKEIIERANKALRNNLEMKE